MRENRCWTLRLSAPSLPEPLTSLPARCSLLPLLANSACFPKHGPNVSSCGKPPHPPAPMLGRMTPSFLLASRGCLQVHSTQRPASGLLQGQDCILLAASPPPGPGAGNALGNYSLVLLLTFRPCCQAEGALVFPASGSRCPSVSGGAC